jgi:hypothetical protein
MAPPPLTVRTRTTQSVAAIGDFSWPEFDRWQAFFVAADIFPARWEGLHVVPEPRTPEAEAYQLRKLALFTEWLDMLERRAPALAHYARQGIRARIERQHAGPECPACDPFNGRDAGPGLETVPPFHPGCRCVLQAVPTAPIRRRTRKYPRSRARAD